MDNKKMAFNI